MPFCMLSLFFSGRLLLSEDCFSCIATYCTNYVHEINLLCPLFFFVWDEYEIEASFAHSLHFISLISLLALVHACAVVQFYLWFNNKWG